MTKLEAIGAQHTQLPSSCSWACPPNIGGLVIQTSWRPVAAPTSAALRSKKACCSGERPPSLDEAARAGLASRAAGEASRFLRSRKASCSGE